ncbi:hypothetical protein LTR70_008398 [Exophiala xenobiotica]|uniref:Aldose 1-epimerase n=1 Tax=Lithohypha guttulata TaxID=1690604 RepID=A0ABR0KDQ6_9EURO|nr:hypothetical protein LTR24_003833 [Lithohypha guttulata]KAK5312045.1 hypothetical protein LTR70_008398 [Exophiala xenobiotica]
MTSSSSNPASDSSVKFLPQGAIIQEFIVGGHNIVLGFSSANAYTYLNAPFFGETIGRVANRIRDGVIKDLNGSKVQLARNNGSNHLHGGSVGWGKRIFTGPQVMNRDGKETVQFTYVSPHGEEGYPGTVELRVWYSTSEQADGGVSKIVLDMEYEAELVGQECEETAINITNHSYFNLSNGATLEGTEVILGTDQHLPVDSGDIPTGTVEKYPGITANEPFVLGPEEPDVDHCFIMDTDAKNVPVDTRSRPLSRLIALSHSATGVHLEVHSTEPAFQFYTGRHIDVPASEHGPQRAARSGLCVEPSRYIDAVNRPEWRDMTILKRGEKYGSRTRYVAWKA